MCPKHQALYPSCAISSAQDRRVAIVSFLLTAMVAGLTASPAAAVVNSATLTTSGGNWSTPAIWTSSNSSLYPLNDTPSTGDTWNVNVGLSVTVDTPIVIDSLNWSAGTLTLSNSLDLVGLTSNSTWSSSSYKDINGPIANLRNSGTIQLTGTYVRTTVVGGGLTNLSGGLFDISGDGAALVNSQIGTFDNQAGATFGKSAGSGTSTVGWTFNNSGTVLAQTGTLAFTYGGTYGGCTTISTGATAEFNAGTFLLQNRGTASGGGNLLVTYATLNVANGGTFTSSAHVVQSGGTLGGGGDTSSKLILNGNYGWSGGTLGGSGVVQINGTNNTWSGGSAKYLNTATASMQNYGTIHLTGTNVYSSAVNSGLTNLSGGVFDISSDGTALVNSQIGTFDNQAGATFGKSAGSGNSTVGWTFNNSGTVLSQTGTLRFTYGGTYGGCTTISTGATVDFNSGTYALQNGGTASGGGNLLVTYATLNVANGGTFTSDARVIQSGGTLGGGGNATSKVILNSDYDWSGGTLGGSGAVQINGTTNTWSGSSAKYLNTATASMQNHGTIHLTGTNVYSSAVNSGLTNLSGGVFDISSDGAALVMSQIGTFDNQAGATFAKSAGNGNSTVGWAFNNSGTVLAQTGTLRFTYGGAYGGNTTISTGATVDFNNGTFALQNGGTASGGGNLLVTYGTLNVANGGTFTSGTHVVQSSGTLGGGGDGSSTLLLNGDYDWSGGTLGGNGVVQINGTTNTWSGSSTKYINATAVNVQNRGTIRLTGTSVSSLATNSGLTNLSGGVFDISSDGVALNNWQMGTFDNQAGATFGKSAGNGDSTVAWTFNNNGTVLAQTGRLVFTHGGEYGGNTTISTGATVEFNSGTFALQNGGTAAGGGNLLVTSGTLNVANGGTFTSGAHVVQSGGTLGGGGNASSKLVLNADYDWSSGTLGGNGVVQINGTTNTWSGNSTKYIDTAAVNVQNRGTIHLTGTSVSIMAINGGLTNMNGGVFDISGDGAALVNWQVGTFDNQAGATFSKSAGNGNSTVAWTFHNSGLVEAICGTLSFTNSFTQSATGSMQANNATIVLPSGTVALQGNLSGSGTILAATIHQNHGTISPGSSPGTLGFSGNLILDSTSELDFDLGSVSDQITVGGNLTLDGTLNVTAVSGFGPGTYPLIDYNGTLTDNGLAFGTLPNGYTYSLVNDIPNTRVGLQVVPEPGMLTLLIFALGSVGLWTWRRRRIQGRPEDDDYGDE